MESTRRSDRINKGKKPTRFGEWELSVNELDSVRPRPNASRMDRDNAEGDRLSSTGNRLRKRSTDGASGTARSCGSRRSSVQLRTLQAEIEAAEEVVRLEKELADSKLEELKLRTEIQTQQIEAQRGIIQRRLELRRVEILEDDMCSTSQDDTSSNSSSMNGPDGDRHALVSEWLKGEAYPKQSTPACTDARREVQPPVQSTAAVDQLTQAFAQAITKVNNGFSNGNDMKRFIARHSSVKELPVFSGEPAEWPNFISQFRQTTELCSYSNTENMARLQKCLKGAAKECVQAFMVTPDNVERVIKTLERRFGRPEQIIQVLVTKVKQMSAPTDGQFESLIQFADAVQNLVQTLQTLKAKAHITNPQLMKEVVEKLPSHLRMDWGRHLHSQETNEADLKMLADWLEEVADAACLVSTPKQGSSSAVGETNNNKPPDGRRGGRHKTKESVLTTSSVDKETPTTCLYCQKENHVLTKCHKFKALATDDRWKWAKEAQVCFVCLKGGHRVSRCEEKKPCNTDGCERLHHAMLHFVKKEQPAVPEVIGHNLQLQIKKCVLLKVVPVTLKGRKGTIETFALLDEGSTVTIIDQTVATAIGAMGPKEPLTVQWTNATTRHDASSERVALSIMGTNGQTHEVENVRTMSNLLLPMQTVEAKKLARKWKYLDKMQLPDLMNARPTILIGQDNCHLITSREVIEGPKNGPVLSRTNLGWIVHGKVTPFRGQLNEVNLCIVCQRESQDDMLEQMVKNTFKTEEFGVLVSKKPIQSDEDTRAQEIMEKTTVRVGERWETGLLWKTDDAHLPESKSSALRRLHSIEKKMDKNRNFAEQYCSKIEDYIDKGYAKKLSHEEVKQEDTKTWYLPHFAVVNEHKPGKIRLVFDAAAQGEGVSLNDALLKGPDLLSPLPSVLCQLRQRRIGFTADIKEMFHQVRIRSEDLPAQRFLWRGKDRDREPDVMEMSVMIFGATCSPSSAQFVKNKNAMEFEEEFPEAVKAITTRHYVDDYLDSTNTEEEATQLISDVVEVHRRGGFTICNWNCSSREVLQHIPPELRSAGSKDLDLETEIPLERVLGLRWDPNSDTFKFSTGFGKIDPRILDGTVCPTKRGVLKVAMSVFDPLGLVSHFMIKSKVLLQDIWRSGIGWDDELSDKLLAKWRTWLQELQDINQVAVPRCYSARIQEAVSIQLHIFCDASEEAFATVAYLRVELEDEVQTAFVMGKTRVAPLKPMSIPRLELQAAVMGSRLAKTIHEIHDLKIGKTFLWTDSRTVLCWLRSDARRFKTFVGHRIGEIEELTNGASWHWVPTLENVADEATRSGKPITFAAGARWWTGPSFLRQPEDEWPRETWSESKEQVNDEDLEVKKEFVGATVSVSDSLPDIARFSKYLKLLRTTAWMLRFINQCRKRQNPPKELSTNEIREAETLWWKKVQWESFQDEMSQLTQGRPIQNGSRLTRLTPVLDQQGCLRLSGRIDAATTVSDEMKQPIILPTKHLYTRLLIQHYHGKAGHHGQESVVNELRQRFWILNMRTAVRSAWNSCLVCRIQRAKPQVPEMGYLPAARLAARERPFTHCGMDYFGPMEVTIGRRREKRYGVLFTCMTTRAVHLEIAASLTTDSAIMSIRRMIARRGQPRCIYSDNGTNLRGAEKELKVALGEFNQAQIEVAMSQREVEWHFNPPSAPHMGGSWERLVRSVKVAMRSTLNARAPREEVLQTVFAEAENMVNSRPLTHISVDPDDPGSLTPNHFLLGTSSSAQPPGVFDDKDLCLRKQWRVAQRLADNYWKRWVAEYLPTLTRRTKWFQPAKPVQVGDLVLVADGDLTRNLWPRGVVTKVYPGRDGRIRVVDVRTQSGTYRRPVAKICVLDIARAD